MVVKGKLEKDRRWADWIGGLVGRPEPREWQVHGRGQCAYEDTEEVECRGIG